MKQFVFATNNPNKLREIKEILGNTVNILSLSDIGFEGDIPETQPTLEGNALQKAQYIYDRFRVPCFADDTGLEVKVLEGAPGVYSARYAGEHCSPEDNMEKLLREMNGKQDRRARFRTVIALIADGNRTYTFEGSVDGDILTEKKGKEGFGYDPVFKPEGYTVSFAEMSAEEKNKISY